jgi:predicted dehydrogenase
MSSRRDFLKQTSAAGVVAAASVQLARAAGDKAASAETATKGSRAPRKNPLRLAIVGTGQISHRYLKQTAGSERARFVATCARTLDEAKARAVEYGIKRWFDDYTAMYDKVKPDAVVIATPPAVHAAPTIAAFERGIHVLCEKPMATTFEDCQAMNAAAQKSGKVFLSLPYDASPRFRAALA